MLKLFTIIILFTIPFDNVNGQLLKRIGFGLKAGTNFANVTGASSINARNKSGFMAGIFLAVPSKKIISYHTELIFSRQGYNFKNGSISGTSDLDYLLMPHLLNLNIGKYLSLQGGGQLALMVSAKADSSTDGAIAHPFQKVLDFVNRFDYGFTAGAEFHPMTGFLVGARINASFATLNKDLNAGYIPSYFPNRENFNLRNNVVQLYAGYRF